MGFFDRFAAKKPAASSSTTPPSSQTATDNNSASSSPAVSSSSAPNSNSGGAETPSTNAPTPGLAGGLSPVKLKLGRAREELEAKDLPAALAIYEELLRTSGDRADVLVTLSGDLGSCGYIEQIIELVAPRYDAERHGPATGINLLQAYLATHNTDAAQHLLDVLFSLNRPEIEERLYGFSNALAELIEAKRLGKVPESVTQAGPNGVPLVQSNVVNLVTISKPIWAYGIENVATVLPPPKAEKTRRVAFTQLSILGLTDLEARTKATEDGIARLSRGLPLWLAETFHYSPQYSAITAIGTMNKDHYVTFGAEWSLQNLRQLSETNNAGLDYVFTGALQQHGDSTELTLRVWEIRRYKERKVFTTRWTAATQDTELVKLAETLRMFMEWSAYSPDAAAPYEFIKTPAAWADTLATSLSLFLTDKTVLPLIYLEPMSETLPRLAARAPHSEKDSLAYLTALDRARRLGNAASVDNALFDSETVEEARGLLGL